MLLLTCDKVSLFMYDSFRFQKIVYAFKKNLPYQFELFRIGYLFSGSIQNIKRIDNTIDARCNFCKRNIKPDL